MSLLIKLNILIFLATLFGPMQVPAACPSDYPTLWCTTTASAGGNAVKDCRLHYPTDQGVCEKPGAGRLGPKRNCCRAFLQPTGPFLTTNLENLDHLLAQGQD
ncbi:uncharacterized protein PGTG_15896 [Puccinia graminis f. sp. tritici CRL 75-36-700-3]|uniref:Uncharacterized protein n=1 Tax=Puccinia graminis f. sp. tritici (strain CRL 75-36-700-3 / race SCCL) TaxID=418459 RepID=E3L0F0_PUCGT|nr:uncharacterized protein PGTG_15896 [Puccinia graminis f. sp. tritici CRL 75-36-700-3]EFP90048.1 hypothetical protein PGTG_15896 [Puccinia graminis f. sp. tritici CRL 75-36-700-3]